MKLWWKTNLKQALVKPQAAILKGHQSCGSISKSCLSLVRGDVGKTPRQGDTLQLNSGSLLAMSCHRRAMSQVYRAAVSIIATGLRDGAEPSSPGGDSRLQWKNGFKGDL